MARVLGIFSGKGGVGKTTLTLNLGMVFANTYNRDTTLVDCNLTASHLGLHLGMYDTPETLNHVLRDEIELTEAIQVHDTGLKIIPAAVSIKELQGVDATKLKDVISDLSTKTELVLLDGSPGFGREAMSGIKSCDEALLVTTPDVPSVMDIVRAQEVLETVDANPLGVVVNMVGKDKHELKKYEIEEFTDLPVIAQIPYDKNVTRSLHLRTPVIKSHPNTKASRHMIKLASNLLGEQYEFQESIWDSLKSIISFRRRR